MFNSMLRVNYRRSVQSEDLYSLHNPVLLKVDLQFNSVNSLPLSAIFLYKK